MLGVPMRRRGGGPSTGEWGGHTDEVVAPVHGGSEADRMNLEPGVPRSPPPCPGCLLNCSRVHFPGPRFSAEAS